MYKVFLNERLIIIGSPNHVRTNKQVIFFDKNATPNDVKKWFKLFSENELHEIYLIHDNPEKFFSIFKKAFKNLPAAGGVVKSAEKLLFIFRRGRWDLPKGKIDDCETMADAALREVTEECGIAGHKIVRQLPSTFHIYRSPYKGSEGEWIFKETVWFEMSYAGNEQGTPEVDEDITELRWFEKGELHNILANTYENLKQIISLYLD